jgi:hypothetical protein
VATQNEYRVGVRVEQPASVVGVQLVVDDIGDAGWGDADGAEPELTMA